MRYYKINSVDHLREIKETNFHPHGHVERKFDLSIYSELVYPLIEGYLDNFAFGFKYSQKDISIIKENGYYFVRNNKEYKFEFPHCPPPVSTTYTLKSTDINSVVEFVLS